MTNDPRFRQVLQGQSPIMVFLAMGVAALLDEADALDDVLGAIAPAGVDWTEVVAGQPMHFWNGMSERQVRQVFADRPEVADAATDAVRRALRARGLDFPENLGDRSSEDRRARGGSVDELMTAERPRVTAATRPAGGVAPDAANPPLDPLRGDEGEPPPPGQADSAATAGPQNVLTAGDIRTIDPNHPLNPAGGPPNPEDAPEAGDPMPGQGVVTLPQTNTAPARPGLAPPGAEQVAAAEAAGLQLRAPADSTSTVTRESGAETEGEVADGESEGEPTFGGHPYGQLRGLSDEQLIELPNIGAATVRRIREYERQQAAGGGTGE